MDKNVIKMDYSPHDIWICGDSSVEKESRAFSCQKEPETVQWIEGHFKSGDTALDIGSNVGAYALIMAKVMKGKGRVYAFEPAWQNFEKLNKNIILNECQDTITAVNVALSDQKKLDVFNYRDLVEGSSLHTVGEAVDFVGNAFEPMIKQEILCYTADQFVDEFGVGDINHIKVDVDGIESKVILGMAKIMASDTCTSMMVELNEAFESDIKCIEFIQSHGFRVVSKKPNPSRFYDSDTVYNYIFSKKA